MLGGYAMTAVTAITAQNTTGVQGIAALAPEIVAQQIASCTSDIGVDAIKIGMLHDAAVIAAVAAALEGVTVPIVAGIMPIHNYAKIAQFAARDGIEIPRWAALVKKSGATAG